MTIQRVDSPRLKRFICRWWVLLCGKIQILIGFLLGRGGGRMFVVIKRDIQPVDLPSLDSLFRGRGGILFGKIRSGVPFCLGQAVGTCWGLILGLHLPGGDQRCTRRGMISDRSVLLPGKIRSESSVGMSGHALPSRPNHPNQEEEERPEKQNAVSHFISLRTIAFQSRWTVGSLSRLSETDRDTLAGYPFIRALLRYEPVGSA